MDEGLVAPPTGTTPQMMRALNHRIVFQCIEASGRASRADIARRTGLSKPTISLAVADLKRAGIVRAAGHRPPTGLGKSSVLFEPDPAAAYVLGIGVGRHWLRTGIADLSGEILARHEVVNRADGTAALVALVAEAVAHVQASAGLSADRIVTTVLGGPGVLDRRARRYFYSPNIPGWSRPGVLDALEAALGRRIIFDHDVALATIAEAALGAARGCPTFVYLWVGSGVGMGLWLNGELYRGVTGTAGEIGFLPLGLATGMDNSSVLAVERRQGRVERNVTARGMVRSAHQLGLRDVDDFRELFARAHGGDPAARKVVEREGRRLAHLVTAVAALLDPGLVLLGGSIGRDLDQLAEPINRELVRLSPLRPSIAAARFGDDAVLLGAITSALGYARDQVFEERMRGIGVQVAPPSPRSEVRRNGTDLETVRPPRRSGKHSHVTARTSR